MGEKGREGEGGRVGMRGREGAAPPRRENLGHVGELDHRGERLETRQGLMPRAGVWTSARGNGTTKAEK